MEVRELEPKVLWNHFADLNAVPRPSKKEERVIQFMLDFADKHGLKAVKDAIGNVVIYKNASPGMENRKTVILQAHLDMVHQKNEGTNFDFEQEGIKMRVDGDWVKAEGTTLGADNGLGVAAIMAVLTDDTIVHPPIEALFTIDEETGMTGAKELDASNLSGKILLNIDTEDDDELSIGCAGGIDTNTKLNYEEESLSDELACYEIKISGLLGGHSGMDIHKGRGNANKLATRVLYDLLATINYKLVSFDGGSLRNAIPREATVVLALSHKLEGQLQLEFAASVDRIVQEFKAIETALQITLKPSVQAKTCVPNAVRDRILNALYSVHNGVFRMSPDMDDLVEASSSLARVIVSNGEFITQSLQRSSVESSKSDVANTIRAAFENAGCAVVQTGDYPGWQPNPNSEILQTMHKQYVELFQEEPQIKACHAGLECGILGKHLPGTDMISFGPNIRGAHSPDEKVQISSVQKFWKFYLKVLAETPSN